MKATKVKIDGKLYQFKYTINSLSELEDNTKYTDLNELQNAANTGSVSAMRALVWAGLIWNKPELTLMETGELMGNLKHLKEFMIAAAKALAESSPEAPKGEKEKADNPTK